MNILPTGCQTQNCSGNEADPAAVGVSSAPDSANYSLQDSLYFNGTPITVVITCPPGADCIPGEPITVTYPPGTFPIPNVPQIPGQPIRLCLTGCQSEVCQTLPADATTAEINTAVAAIIQAVAQQQAECDYQPPTAPPGYIPQMLLLELSQTFACLSSTYSASITASSIQRPVTFNITGGSLPPGIVSSSAVNGYQFLLTGTPTTAGSYAFTVTATNALGQSVVRAYTLVVVGITTASPLMDAVQNEIYSVTLAQTGMSGTLIWGITSGSLPVGLALNSATGEITGTPTTLGSSSFVVFVQNATQQCAKAFAVEVVESNCEILTDAQLGDTNIDEAYSVQLTSLPVETPLWFVISGTLPTGLTLDAFSGLLAGTPTAAGTFIFSIQVTENCEKAFTLEVVSNEIISCITNPTNMGEYGNGEAVFIEPTPADPPPIGFNYTWTIVSGALPAGLTLSVTPGPTGNLGGTVDAGAAEGVYNFCIEVNEVPE